MLNKCRLRRMVLTSSKGLLDPPKSPTVSEIATGFCSRFSSRPRRLPDVLRRARDNTVPARRSVLVEPSALLFANADARGSRALGLDRFRDIILRACPP